jgi:hypothetical protein
MDRATAQPERNRLSALWLPGILLVVGIPTMIFGSFLLGLIVTLAGSESSWRLRRVAGAGRSSTRPSSSLAPSCDSGPESREPVSRARFLREIGYQA